MCKKVERPSSVGPWWPPFGTDRLNGLWPASIASVCRPLSTGVAGHRGNGWTTWIGGIGHPSLIPFTGLLPRWKISC